jgi:UDP-perosamine 4-acetyltransferase
MPGNAPVPDAAGDVLDVVVVGGGGHALVAIEVLRSAGFGVAGCLTADGTASADLPALGIATLGTTEEIPNFVDRGRTRWFVAVGDNRARLELSRAVTAAGGRIVTAVSPAAVVSPSAIIASGVLVMPGAVVNALASIDDGAIVNTGATIDHECTIGAFAHLAPRAALAGRVDVGEGTLIGIGSAVAPGVRIGAWTVVGAGAAVVGDVGNGATVVGVPARMVQPRSDATTSGTAIATTARVPSARGGSAGVAAPGSATPKVLVVCTANLCRSPLVAALLRAGLEEARLEADVASAGLTAVPGQLPDRKLLRVADELGVTETVAVHRSRPVTAEQLAAADLVLTMTTEHLEQIERLIPGYDRAVALRTAGWRARVLGGRPLPFEDWARRLAGGLPEPGGALGASDDIDDPIGGRLRQYRAMADDVDALVRTLVDHWSGR